MRQRPCLKPPRAYWNWLVANCELVARRSVIRARPLKLVFDPTNYCQLECPLCPTGARVHDRARGTASRHVFEHLLDEIGDYLFLVDFFNWGEPLLNPHTEDFITAASRRGIVTTLSTNLSTQLTDRRIERIVTSGLNKMIVSLDGASADTYGTYRRRGRFDLVVENMQRLLDVRRALGRTTPLIDWQYLVFRFNEHEMPLASQLAQRIGVDSLTFRAPFLDQGRYPLSEQDRAAVASWKPSDPRFDMSRVEEHSVAARPRCGWHYMATAINWDGTVTPCCTVFEREHDFARLDGRSPGEYMSAVNSEKFRAVRDSFAGRRPAGSLVCDHCPTPGLMTYHKHLNHQIALYSIASLVDALAHPMRRVRERRQRRAPQVMAEVN